MFSVFYPAAEVTVFDVVSNVNINVAVDVVELPVGTAVAELYAYCLYTV